MLRIRLAVVLVAFVTSHDAHAKTVREPSLSIETPLTSGEPAPRTAHWATALGPLVVTNLSTNASSLVRLYASDGGIDEGSRDGFERVASSDAQPHSLSLRLEQLIVKAAYRFHSTRIAIVSAFRTSAGKHGTGEAVDFKLDGVRPARLAAYLRSLPRTGVGIYTHPRTQFVHLDVRTPSYHWIDASPPGTHWREGVLADPTIAKRDGRWKPEMDLPL